MIIDCRNRCVINLPRTNFSFNVSDMSLTRYYIPDDTSMEYICSRPDASGIHSCNTLPQSTYKGNVEVSYEPANPDHPATAGVAPFTVIEEPYKFVFRPENAEPLLKANSPDSDEVVAWSTQYNQSRVAAIEPGHGWQIFENPEYKKFLAQTIRWVAGRTGKEGE